jgi:hypothetical protein
MSDRKYKQRGYQDEGPRERRPASGFSKPPAELRDPRIPRDPKTPNMPGFREVFRCTRCGHLAGLEVTAETRCGKCGVPLHACIHCASFDSGARFECRETIPSRVSPKDAANSCTLFAPRVSVERETHSTPSSTSGSSGARKAFDDLFKF